MLHSVDFKGHIKDEKKFFDVLNTSNNVSSSWTVDICNPSFKLVAFQRLPLLLLAPDGHKAVAK